ncbi:MAG: methyltransferase [Alphaproteobacteria bacterium]|nr:methyltransferase [Alphaproteobacteria bacterium]
MDSNLQIISGKWRGKKLHLPPNARPTQNKARIALFNMLGNITPKIVWDAFAGSGGFGLEWLSRTPHTNVIFTDINTESIKTIQKNLSLLNETNSQIIQTDAISAIPKFGSNTDLIFIDPPYTDVNLGVRFIKKIAPIAKTGVIIIWEIEKNFKIPVLPENLKIIKDKSYGRARFLILTKI